MLVFLWSAVSECRHEDRQKAATESKRDTLANDAIMAPCCWFLSLCQEDGHETHPSFLDFLPGLFTVLVDYVE